MCIYTNIGFFSKRLGCCGFYISSDLEYFGVNITDSVVYVCWTQEEKQVSPVWRFLGKNDLPRVARVYLFETVKRCFVAFVTLLKTN